MSAMGMANRLLYVVMLPGNEMRLHAQNIKLPTTINISSQSSGI